MIFTKVGEHRIGEALGSQKIRHSAVDVGEGSGWFPGGGVEQTPNKQAKPELQRPGEWIGPEPSDLRPAMPTA